MCLTCYRQTPYLLCEACYEREQQYIAAIGNALAGGVFIHDGAVREGERSRQWCEERDRRIAEEVG